MKLVEVHVEKFRNFDDSEVVANREFERSVYESLAPMIHAIALWRYGQGVYRFDDHLAAELLDTPLSSGLPAEVLTRLPEWCPLIVAPRCEGWPSEFAGVFVCHSWNASAKRRELRLVYIPTQVATPLISILPPERCHLGRGARHVARPDHARCRREGS